MRVPARPPAAVDHDPHRQHLFLSHRRAMPMAGLYGMLVLRD